MTESIPYPLTADHRSKYHHPANQLVEYKVKGAISLLLTAPIVRGLANIAELQIQYAQPNALNMNKYFG